MRRILTAMLALLFIIGCVFAITSCGENDEPPQDSTPPEKLEAPVVTLNGDTALWKANPKAERFEISINGTVTLVENTKTSQKLADGQSVKVRALGDGVNTANSDWSNTVLYTAPDNGGGEEVPDNKTPTYIITWKNGDTVLETDEVLEGTVPEYNGQVPTKDGYTFIGWLPEVKAASSNTIYIAQFKVNEPETPKFTVTFVDYDGTVLDTQAVEKGGDATAPSDPKREGFVFTGWDKEFTGVTQDITVTAQYEIAGLQLVVDYSYEGSKIAVTLYLEGDVSISAIELKMSFYLNHASYADCELAQISYADANYVDGVFYYSLMTEENITGEVELFTLIFDLEDVSEASAKAIVDEGVAYDGNLERVEIAQIVYCE